MQGVDVYGSDEIRFYTDYDIEDLTPSEQFYSGYYDGMEVRALDNANDWKKDFQIKKIEQQILKQRQDTPNASHHRKVENHNSKVRKNIESDLYGFQSWIVTKYNNQNIRPESGNPYFTRVNPDDPNDMRVDWNPEFRKQVIENGGMWSPANRRELDKIVF